MWVSWSKYPWWLKLWEGVWQFIRGNLGEREGAENKKCFNQTFDDIGSEDVGLVDGFNNSQKL